MNTLARHEPLSKTRLRLWLRLLKTTQGIEAELRRRLRDEFGTTLPRFDVLAALSRHPDGLKMGALSQLLRVSGGNVTGIVDKLVDEGLVERVAVPDDRRAHLARITDRGAQAFADLAAAHEGWIDQLLGGLGPGEAEALSDLLGRVQPREDMHAQ